MDVLTSPPGSSPRGSRAWLCPMWGGRRLVLPLPGPWVTAGLGHSCLSTVQEHLAGAGCQDLTRMPILLFAGVLVKWLLQWQEAVWLEEHSSSGIPHHPPLQMRNGISAWLCLAAGAGRGVQTPLAEPSLPTAAPPQQHLHGICVLWIHSKAQQTHTAAPFPSLVKRIVLWVSV